MSFEHDVHAAEDAARRLARALSPASSAEIHINAGGAAGWIIALIASFCCAVMLGLSLTLHGEVNEQDRKIERMQDYLNAIYMQAPQLRPKDEAP